MDVEQIKALVELMSQNALTEVMIRDGESRIVLRRGPTGGVAVQHVVAAPTLAAPPAAAGSAPAAAPPAAPAAHPDAGLHEIKSPMVGTFYTSSSPDSPPFVRVGSVVDKDTVVCIIEAMKVFNEIKAECSGTVERVAVTNASPVEFGQALFLVRPHG